MPKPLKRSQSNLITVFLDATLKIMIGSEKISLKLLFTIKWNGRGLLERPKNISETFWINLKRYFVNTFLDLFKKIFGYFFRALKFSNYRLFHCYHTSARSKDCSKNEHLILRNEITSLDTYILKPWFINYYYKQSLSVPHQNKLPIADQKYCGLTSSACVLACNWGIRC